MNGTKKLGRSGQVLMYSWKHKLCKCCGWRFVSSRNPANCIQCRYIRGKSTAGHNRQYQIFLALEDSAEYKAYMQVRHRGLLYPIELAAGLTPYSKGKLNCDELDETEDAECRLCKEQ